MDEEIPGLEVWCLLEPGARRDALTIGSINTSSAFSPKVTSARITLTAALGRSYALVAVKIRVLWAHLFALRNLLPVLEKVGHSF